MPHLPKLKQSRHSKSNLLGNHGFSVQGDNVVDQKDVEIRQLKKELERLRMEHYQLNDGYKKVQRNLLESVSNVKKLGKANKKLKRGQKKAPKQNDSELLVMYQRKLQKQDKQILQLRSKVQNQKTEPEEVAVASLSDAWKKYIVIPSVSWYHFPRTDVIKKFCSFIPDFKLIGVIGIGKSNFFKSLPRDDYLQSYFNGQILFNPIDFDESFEHQILNLFDQLEMPDLEASLVILDRTIGREELSQMKQLRWENTTIVFPYENEKELDEYNIQKCIIPPLPKLNAMFLLKSFVQDCSDDLASDVAKTCQYCPQRIAIAGGYLRSKLPKLDDSWIRVSELWKENQFEHNLRATFYEMEESKVFSHLFRRLIQLSVFPFDQPLPLPIIAITFNLPILYAREIADQLYLRGMIEFLNDTVFISQRVLQCLKELVFEDSELPSCKQLQKQVLKYFSQYCHQNSNGETIWASFRLPFEIPKEQKEASQLYYFQFLPHHMQEAESDIIVGLYRDKEWFSQVLNYFPNRWIDEVFLYIEDTEICLRNQLKNALYEFQATPDKDAPVILSQIVQEYFNSRQTLGFQPANREQTPENTILLHMVINGREKSRISFQPGKNQRDPISVLSALNSQTIVVCTESGYVGLINIKKSTQEVVYKFDTPVSALATKGHNLMVTGHIDGTVNIFNLKTREIEDTHQNHKTIINCVAITMDGKFVLTSAEEEGYPIRMYDISMGLETKYFKGHASRVTNIRIDQQDKFFYSSSFDGTIRMYLIGQQFKKHVEKEDGLIEIQVPNQAAITTMSLLTTTRFSGKYCVAGFENGMVRIIDLADGTVVDFISIHKHPIRNLSVTSNGTFVCLSDWKGNISVLKISIDAKETDHPHFEIMHTFECADGLVPAFIATKERFIFCHGRSSVEKIPAIPMANKLSGAPIKTAFIVGCGHYREMERLKSPYSDAKAMEQLCLDTGMVASNIRFELDPTCDRLFSQWQQYVEHITMLKRRYPNNQVISFVYFSGYCNSKTHSPFNYVLPIDWEPFSKNQDQLTRRSLLQQNAFNIHFFSSTMADLSIVFIDGSKSELLNAPIIPEYANIIEIYSFSKVIRDEMSELTCLFNETIRKYKGKSIYDICNLIKDQISEEFPCPMLNYKTPCVSYKWFV